MRPSTVEEAKKWAWVGDLITRKDGRQSLLIATTRGDYHFVSLSDGLQESTEVRAPAPISEGSVVTTRGPDGRAALVALRAAEEKAAREAEEKARHKREEEATEKTGKTPAALGDMFVITHPITPAVYIVASFDGGLLTRGLINVRTGRRWSDPVHLPASFEDLLGEDEGRYKWFRIARDADVRDEHV